MTAPSPRPLGMHPQVFALLTALLTALAVTAPPGGWSIIALVAGLAALLALAVRLPPQRLLHTLLHAAPFLLLAGLTFPHSGPASPALSVLARAVTALVLLVTLRHALGEMPLLAAMRGFGLPPTLVLVMALALRFTGVISHELRRLLRAARSRSPRALGPRLAAAAAALVLVRSMERSERVHRAMAARGFDGQSLALASPPLACRDWLAVALIASAAAIWAGARLA